MHTHTIQLIIHTVNKGNHFQPGHFKVRNVVGVMKMGKIVPRVGIESAALAFRVSLLPLHYVSSLTSPLFPRLHVYAAPCNVEQGVR